ncbi:endothelin-converting enzyme homolog isoform X1 [Ruditapes philippinarum]|uniref:endothelin-converting enzyme homolog isoform X1 n=1 Tax=Ruditapes philippinarum TaxID=129788 RepID=UPI00295B9B08|nr:endothelin-converting enzyme homolog isoform X1 [Ruditapes philippinarum]
MEYTHLTTDGVASTVYRPFGFNCHSTNCIEESEPLNENGRHNNIKDKKNKKLHSTSSNYGESEKGLIQYIKNASYDSFKRRGSHEMEDAPFQDSRTGSEEDFLEYDDDDPVFNCDACKRRRRLTGIEKALIAFGVVCVIIIIALAAHIGKKKDVKVPEKCESAGCLKAASSLLGAMDPTADPCEDFHQYACGGWLKETPIPPGYRVWDRFQELAYKNMYMLKDFIESHTLHSPAQEKVRIFHKSCMAESKVGRQKTLNDFKGLLANISKDGQVFNLMNTLSEVHKLNTWPLFQIMVGPDERNPVHNIIKIEAASSPFPYGIFKSEEKKLLHQRSANNTAETETSGNDTDTSGPSSVAPNLTTTTNGTENNNNETITEAPTPRTTTKLPHIKHTHPHPVHNLSDLVKDYLKETSLLLQTLWDKQKEEADNLAEMLLVLEKKLSLAHDIDLHIHNRTQAYNAMKVKTLQTKCGNMIPWANYLNGIVGSPSKRIADQTEVIVLHENALLEVCVIVNEYKQNKTLTGILSQYIALSIARSMFKYFDLSTFDPEVDQATDVDMEGEHWRRCTFYTNKAMGLATGAIYVNATSIDKSMSRDVDRVEKIKVLVDYVKKAFKEYLLRKIWMDSTTKQHASAKIDEMIEKVSYPSFILNTTFLDQFYEQFSVGSDWFRNLLNWRTFTIQNMINDLNESFDRHNSWLNPPVTVESDYSPVRNDIIFPIALFHLPIFSNEGPSALNFGAIGSLIGHEITHAFDIQGRQYDGKGVLRDWWDPLTAKQFNVTTHCMKDQYDHFKINNHTINGEQTLEENIADNGGLRAANIAYELWLNEHGTEEPIPGVTLTNRQIFYVSFAQLYCSKWTDSGIEDFLLWDTHSPGPYRIEGALSNSLAFQEVFKCSYISQYNPATKCEVW